MPGNPGWRPTPEPKGPPKTGSEAFHDALDNFFKDGGQKHYDMGPDRPWTQDLKKHPHVNKVVNEIIDRVHQHCKGFRKLQLNQPQPASFNLNEQTVRTNVLHLMRDFFAGLNLTPAQFSMGGFRMTYTVKSIDCEHCNAKVEFNANDELTMRSLTRIPFTSFSLWPKNDPNGPSGKYGTVYLTWHWGDKVLSY